MEASKPKRKGDAETMYAAMTLVAACRIASHTTALKLGDKRQHRQGRKQRQRLRHDLDE